MKKTYIVPSILVANIGTSDIICASVSFGTDETPTMNAIERLDMFESSDAISAEELEEIF